MKKFYLFIFVPLLVFCGSSLRAIDLCVMTSGIDVDIKVKIAEREPDSAKKLIPRWGKDFVESRDLYFDMDLYSNKVTTFDKVEEYEKTLSDGMFVYLAYRFVSRAIGKGYIKQLSVKIGELAKRAMLGYQYFGVNLSKIMNEKQTSPISKIYIVIHPDGRFSQFSIAKGANSEKREQELQTFVKNLCIIQKTIKLYHKETDPKKTMHGLELELKKAESFKKNRYNFGGLDKRLNNIIQDIKQSITELKKKKVKSLEQM